MERFELLVIKTGSTFLLLFCICRDTTKDRTIVKRLSKYYNINIVADPSTSGLTCSGELILKDELIRVLDVICNTAQIQYTWDSEKRTYMLHR